MNGQQFPPPGTKCVDCVCCMANVYAGNDPLCWECDERSPCKGTKRPVVDASDPEIAVPEPTLIQRVNTIEGDASLKIGKVLARAPKPEPADPLPDLRSQYDRDEPGTTNKEEKQEVQEENDMKKPSGGRGRRIPDEVRAQIQAEPKELSHEAVARRYGISGVAARAIRMEAKKKPAKVTPIVQKVEVSAPSPTAGIRVTISAELTEEGADTYWRNLSLEQKGAMIELQLREILKRATA